MLVGRCSSQLSSYKLQAKSKKSQAQSVDGHGQDLLLVGSDQWIAVVSHYCQNQANNGTPYSLRIEISPLVAIPLIFLTRFL